MLYGGFFARYRLFYLSHRNRTTSLKFSGPVYHPMEQLMYKYYVYILTDIDCIQLFVTYPYLVKTNHFNKFVPCVFGVATVENTVYFSGYYH